MEWAEFVAWAIFIFFMSIVFPIVLVGFILWVTFRRQRNIRLVPSTPYVIDQTGRQTEPPNVGFVHTIYPNSTTSRNSINESNVNIQMRDVPPPYSSIRGSQFPGLQTQLPYSEQNAMHFPIPSNNLQFQFNTEKPNQPPTFVNAQAATTVQPSNPPSEPAYQLSVQATYQNGLNNQPQNQASFQAQVAIPNSIPLQTLTRPTTLAISSTSEQSNQNQFIPIPSPFTSQEPTSFPPMPSSSSNRTVNDDPPPSYHKIDKL